MAGENTTDESRSGEERLRVAMFIPVLDLLIVQLQERFSDEQIGLMKEMSLFSSGALKSASQISPTVITHLTQTYHLDSDAIAAEYRDFCRILTFSPGVLPPDSRFRERGGVGEGEERRGDIMSGESASCLEGGIDTADSV